MTRTLDVSLLPEYDIGNDAPLSWAQFCIIAIEGTMFSLLIATYFYLRLGVDVWPPPGDQMPHLLLPTIALVPLIASCIPAFYASKAAKHGERGKAIAGMALNLAFGLVFFVMRLFEWHSLNFNWASDAHGSIVWAILGLHTFDYVALMVETAVILAITISGRWGEKQKLGIHADSITWYFIVAIWIPLYVTIYWGARIVQSR